MPEDENNPDPLKETRQKMQTVGEMVYKMHEQVAPTLEQMRKAKETFEKIAKPLNDSLEVVRSFSKKVAEEKERMEQSSVFLPSHRTIPISEITFAPKRVRLSDEDYEIIADKVSAKVNKKTSESESPRYQLPADARWEKLRIKFFDGHTVKVKYPGIPMRTFDFKQMGFEDRKEHNPDTKWNFLLTMSERGSITHLKFDKRYNRTVKFETSERLKKFFGMNENPFEPYTKQVGHRPKFALIPESDFSAFEESVSE